LEELQKRLFQKKKLLHTLLKQKGREGSLNLQSKSVSALRRPKTAAFPRSQAWKPGEPINMPSFDPGRSDRSIPKHIQGQHKLQQSKRDKDRRRREHRLRARGEANDELCNQIMVDLRTKITEHTRGDHDRTRTAGKMFGCNAQLEGGGGIDIRGFRNGLRQWNIVLTPEETRLVFSRLDTGTLLVMCVLKLTIHIFLREQRKAVHPPNF
jgi:hypothetical protein